MGADASRPSIKLGVRYEVRPFLTVTSPLPKLLHGVVALLASPPVLDEVLA